MGSPKTRDRKADSSDARALAGSADTESAGRSALRSPPRGSRSLGGVTSKEDDFTRRRFARHNESDGEHPNRRLDRSRSRDKAVQPQPPPHAVSKAASSAKTLLPMPDSAV